MADRVEQIQILYEIAIAVGADLNLDRMLRKGLSTMIKKLNCSAGEIYFTHSESGSRLALEKVCSIPRINDRNIGIQLAREEFVRIEDSAGWEALRQRLPMHLDNLPEQGHVYLFDLPEIGILALVKTGLPLDQGLIQDLQPLMKKFASGCQSSLQGNAYEKSRLMFETVLNTVGEGIITIDQTGTIIMVNEEVGRIWGYQQDELVGGTLDSLMPTRFREAHTAGLARYAETGISDILGKRIELEGLKRDGSVFPLELRITHATVENQVLYTAAVRDITKRRELEKMRDNFVSTVSHELRTPLASIMGYLETVISGRPGPLTKIQEKFLKNSYKNSERLLKLIEEILTISRIQQGELQLVKSQFNPSDAVQSVHEMVKTVAAPKSITLHLASSWPCDRELFGDQSRLEQVLINLTSNAIKFSPEGAVVRIFSTCYEGGWQVEITDEGIGIPKDEIPKLFDRFYRASNASDQQIQGTGLGLYVCKAIVEAHGGEVGLHSELGVGTKAWFKIPIEQK